jgi:hypothetical protein
MAPLETTPACTPTPAPRRLPLALSGDRVKDRQAGAFRRMLEAAILRIHGEIDEGDAVVVWTATQAFRRSLHIGKRLRQQELSHSERLACEGMVTRLEGLVCRHVKSLGLDSATAPTVWNKIYSKGGVAVLEEAARHQSGGSNDESSPSA